MPSKKSHYTPPPPPDRSLSHNLSSSPLQTGPGKHHGDDEMQHQMTPNLKLEPGGLRLRTLPLGHAVSPQY